MYLCSALNIMKTLQTTHTAKALLALKEIIIYYKIIKRKFLLKLKKNKVKISKIQFVNKECTYGLLGL